MPLKVQLVTVNPLSPRFVCPPTEIPCPAPIVQLVTVKSLQKTFCGFTATSSSPTERLQFSIR